MNQQHQLGISGRIAAYFSDSKLTPLIILASVLLGVFAVVTLPRDVPILTLTFWGEGYDHYRLRRIAAEVEREVKTVDNVSETSLIGGLRRQIKVLLDPKRLSAYHIDPLMVVRALDQSNRELLAGRFAQKTTKCR